MTGFGVILVFAGGILLLAGLMQMAQNKSFKDAKLITGTVIDKRQRQLKNGTAYELMVVYMVNGVEYSKVVGVKRSEYHKISEEADFDMKYRPDKPYKAINPDALNPEKARGVIVFGAVMAALGVVLLIVGLFL